MEPTTTSAVSDDAVSSSTPILPPVSFPAQTNTVVDSLNTARKKHEVCYLFVVFFCLLLLVLLALLFLYLFLCIFSLLALIIILLVQYFVLHLFS